MPDRPDSTDPDTGSNLARLGEADKQVRLVHDDLVGEDDAVAALARRELKEARESIDNARAFLDDGGDA